ncbi:MAG: hypothetical protein ACD_50C00284G0002 [uncultured bacterium]|nr:MAG: hypothetical protein ACD_50C00284G0002 [uncultured bacterium]
MKLMKFFLLNKKKVKNDLAYFKQDLLLKIGKEQFKKLMDLGITIPVALR